jgi:hypothetical protein
MQQVSYAVRDSESSFAEISTQENSRKTVFHSMGAILPPPRNAVGRVAREAIGEAVENNMQDMAFDAAVSAAGREAADVQQLAEFGSNADSAFEAAMTAADVASSLDKASDAVEAARKVNKARKVIKRVR